MALGAVAAAMRRRARSRECGCDAARAALARQGSLPSHERSRKSLLGHERSRRLSPAPLLPESSLPRAGLDVLEGVFFGVDAELLRARLAARAEGPCDDRSTQLASLHSASVQRPFPSSR